MWGQKNEKHKAPTKIEDDKELEGILAQMWDKDMPANENVELLVEKLLDEEVARLMAGGDESDDAELEGFDDGEEMVGGIADQPSDRDGLGLNRAKATVLAGEEISLKP